MAVHPSEVIDPHDERQVEETVDETETDEVTPAGEEELATPAPAAESEEGEEEPAA